jgi:glycosyltransferase involved in cell wall biosynthesis
MAGLVAAGVDIIEIRAPIWDDVRDKALLHWHAVARRLLSVLFAYPRLVARYLAAPDHDVVIAGCLGQLDVLVLWPFARLRKKPVIWDNFISLYSTIVENRQIVSPSNPLSVVIKLLEALASRSVTRVVLDTKAHAAYFARLYGLPESRLGAVVLGAEQIFVREAGCTRKVPRQRPLILFYGKFAPTHGLDVVVDAATSERGGAFDWKIVGTGQEAQRFERRLGSRGPSSIERIDWIPYEELPRAIADADVCLGMFGSGGKSSVALPNKVFQTLASGQRLVTRDSVAIREIVRGDERHVALVVPDDPNALLDGIEKVLGMPLDPQEHANILRHITPQAVGSSLLLEIQAVLAAAQCARRGTTISSEG